MKKSVIYKIVFQDGNIYVGQTQDWEKRKREHQRTKGRGSPKLEKAFQQDPEPAYYIIEETDDLDNREQYWIQKLRPELNTLPGGEAMRGLNHPRAHYTREQILEVVDLWCNTACTLKDISILTEVNYSTVCDIIHGRTHHWATQHIDLRQHDRKHTYKIWDPLGNTYQANTLRELELQTGIPHSTLSSILNSKSGVGKNGWGITPPITVTVTDPNNHTFQTTVPLLKTLLKDCGLSNYQVDRVTKHFKPSAGWRVTICP